MTAEPPEVPGVLLAAPLPPRAALRLHHDEYAQVYLNGVRVLSRGGLTTDYEAEEIDVKALRLGRNVLAIHCRQTTSGQYIDAGLDPQTNSIAAWNTLSRRESLLFALQHPPSVRTIEFMMAFHTNRNFFYGT